MYKAYLIVDYIDFEGNLKSHTIEVSAEIYRSQDESDKELKQEAEGDSASDSTRLEESATV